MYEIVNRMTNEVAAARFAELEPAQREATRMANATSDTHAVVDASGDIVSAHDAKRTGASS